MFGRAGEDRHSTRQMRIGTRFDGLGPVRGTIRAAALLLLPPTSSSRPLTTRLMRWMGQMHPTLTRIG